jgi:hypothetical protein
MVVQQWRVALSPRVSTTRRRTRSSVGQAYRRVSSASAVRYEESKGDRFESDRKVLLKGCGCGREDEVSRRAELQCLQKEQP